MNNQAKSLFTFEAKSTELNNKTPDYEYIKFNYDKGRLRYCKVRIGDKVIENNTLLCVIELDNGLEMELKSKVRGIVEDVYLESGDDIFEGDFILEIKVDKEYIPVILGERFDVIFDQFENAVIDEIFVKENQIVDKVDSKLYSAVYDNITFEVKNRVCGKIVNIRKKSGDFIYKDDLIMSIINQNEEIEHEEEVQKKTIKDIIFEKFDEVEIEHVFIKPEEVIFEEDKDILISVRKDEDASFKIINKSYSGKIVEVLVNSGEVIKRGDIIARVELLEKEELDTIRIEKLKKTCSDISQEAEKMKQTFRREISVLSLDDISEFGDDADLSDLDFSRKYGNQTYKENISDSLLRELVLHECSFSIKTDDIGKTVERVEFMIEACHYSCRVYTENRSAALGAAAFSGIGTLFGAAAAVGIAAHNLATYDPDFEIGKNLLDGKVNVTYKK